MLTPEQYLKVLALGFQLEPPPFVRGLCGRIIRGKTAADFEKLSDDPNRLVVMLTDSQGLGKMLGKTGYQMLITVGHHPDHIKKQLAAGKSYKIVVFPEGSALLATWDNLLGITSKVYPDVAADCAKLGMALKSTKYADIEKAAGYKFADVDDPGNARFMSHAAYLAGARNAETLRALMYHTLHIRELFAGDGFTYDEHGKRGVKEYFMLNEVIANIPGAVVADIQV